MKQIMLVGQYNPNQINVGGMEIYMRNLIDELKKNRIKTTILGWSHEKNQDDNFTSVVVSKKLLGRKFSLNLLIKVPFMKIPKDIPIIIDRPDRVFPFIFRKNKIVCILHGSHGKNVLKKKGGIIGFFYNIIEYISLRRADLIISVSNENKDYYCKKIPMIKKKIIMIPVGVSGEFKPLNKEKIRKEYGFRKNEKIAIYIGRLEKEKQVDKIIKAFDGNEGKLLIVGSGTEEEKLKELAKNKSNIKFFGSFEYKKIPRILNCADFLILFSEFEGLPTVILESLACGVPVLSSEVGDVSSFIKNGQNGYIVNEENFKKKINLLFKNASRMKQECIETSKDYSWDTVAKKILGAL